jgi:hypothetical protein
MNGRTHDAARILLAGIRLFNGTAALVAPRELARRLGVDPDLSPGALYFIRLFGIRTVLVGAELLVRRGARRDEALRLGILIHASDTVAAAMAAASGRLPPGAGRMVTAISAVNTALAIYASSCPSQSRSEDSVDGRRARRWS